MDLVEDQGYSLRNVDASGEPQRVSGVSECQPESYRLNKTREIVMKLSGPLMVSYAMLGSKRVKTI